MSDVDKERSGSPEDSISEGQQSLQKKLRMPDWLRSLARDKGRTGAFSATWLLVHPRITNEARLRIVEILGGTKTGFVRNCGEVRGMITSLNETGDLEGELKALNARLNPKSMRDALVNGHGCSDDLTDEEIRLLMLNVEDEKMAEMMGVTVPTMERRLDELHDKYGLSPDCWVIRESRKRLAKVNRRRGRERRKSDTRLSEKLVAGPMPEMTTKDRIVEAAIEYVDLYGEEELRFPEIAHRAGVSLDELRSYFAKRDELVEAIKLEHFGALEAFDSEEKNFE